MKPRGRAALIVEPRPADHVHGAAAVVREGLPQSPVERAETDTGKPIAPFPNDGEFQVRAVATDTVRISNPL